MPTSVGTRGALRKGKNGLGHLSLHLAPPNLSASGLVTAAARGYREGMNEASHTADQREHPIDQKVLTLMDKRLETARGLADAAGELAEARSRLEDAQRAYVDSFKQAEKAGWDKKELTTHLNFEEPGKAPRKRAAPRKPAAAPQGDTGAAPSTGDGDTADE